MEQKANTTNINRFIKAQDSYNSYNDAINELRKGKKETHWIWFIFPQIKGLGKSETAKYYAIDSLDEANMYLQNPILRNRLAECCEILLELAESDPVNIFGRLDAKKVKSCMTLFSEISDEKSIFNDILTKFYKGEKDKTTLRIIYNK
ncbi:uncharacterized protein (DUF1810 family) [Dysgonomonadaceae bacterium PH5-43]|nr:uncharacterized protein (DUF1810 family) [Dysgonomonadaceae bacterium PH5-43]